MNSLKEAATSIVSTVETEVSHEIRFIEAINYYLCVIDNHKISKLQLMRLASEFSKLVY